MARGMNHVYLVGALAREPELRYTNSGIPVYEATVAGESHIVGSDGHPRQLPYYHRISMLGKPAEWAQERGLSTGSVVMVEGALEYRSWEAEDGAKRSMVRIKALRLEGVEGEHQTVQDSGGGVRLSGGLNQAVIIGNLTRDPELRYTQTGDAVMGLSLAVNENYQDRSGERQEKTHFVDVTLWRELAERTQNLRKGDPIMVMGRVTNEQWTDRDGNKRNSTKIEATHVEALSRGAGAGGPATTPAARPEARPSAARPAQADAANAGTRAGRPAATAAGGGYQSGGIDIDQGLEDYPPEEEDLPF